MPRDEADYTRLLTLYRNRVDAYADMPGDFGQRWRHWCRILVEHGGELVVPPMRPESDLDELLASGRPVTSATRFVEGEDNGCHGNAAMLWADGVATAIGTGYALSEDGLWRQHSWGVDADGVLVETTLAREAYVGLTITEQTECLMFAVQNNRDHLNAIFVARGPRAAPLGALWRQMTEARDLAAAGPAA